MVLILTIMVMFKERSERNGGIGSMKGSSEMGCLLCFRSQYEMEIFNVELTITDLRCIIGTIGLV